MEHGQNGQPVSEEARQMIRPNAAGSSQPVLPGPPFPSQAYPQGHPNHAQYAGPSTGPQMNMPGMLQQTSQPIPATFSQATGGRQGMPAPPAQMGQPMPAGYPPPANQSSQPMPGYAQQPSQPMTITPSQPIPAYNQQPGYSQQTGPSMPITPPQLMYGYAQQPSQPMPVTPSQPIPAIPPQFTPGYAQQPSQPMPATPSQPMPSKPKPSAPFLSLPSRMQSATDQQIIPGYAKQPGQFRGMQQLPSQYSNSSPHAIVLPGYRQPNRLNGPTATYPMLGSATYPVNPPAYEPQPAPSANPIAWPSYSPPPYQTPPQAPNPVQEAPVAQPETASPEQPKAPATGASSEGQQKGKARRVRRLHRVPELRQVTAVECGAACLAMVLTYFGRVTSVSEVQERCGVGRDGLSALAIVKAARQYNLRVRAVSLKQNDFRFISLPAIIHWEFNHFIVIERWSSKFVDVLDPALGRRRLTHEEFDEGFTGVVIMLEPGVQFEKQGPQQSLSMYAYMRTFMNRPGIIVQIILTSLLLQAIGLGGPFLVEFITDNIIAPKNVNLLSIIIIGIIILVFTQAVTTLLRASLLIYLQTHIDARMMLNFFEHMLSLPYRFFQLRLSGDLLTRVNSNIAIRDLLTGQLISTLLDGTSVIIYLIILLTISKLITVITLAFGIAQAILLFATAPTLRTLTQRDLAAGGKTQGYMNEILAGISTLKAAGAEHRAFNRWINLFFDEMNISIRHTYIASVIGIVLDMLHMLSPLILLWVGAGQVIDGQMKLGEMMALNALAASFLGPFGSLVSSGSSIQIIRAHFERIADVVTAEPEQDLQNVYMPPRLSGHIELRNVSFQYDPNAEPTLQNISLVIRPGQKVALVGRTGSGKSTLGKLLIGLMTPTEGAIYYDGIPLDKLSLSDVRKQFGVVLQESFIFSGSVKDNIALNNPDMDMEQVEYAAQMAAIHDDIEKMPMEYETLVAEGGSAFSGGQRQRLALARALANHPSILLLDEATSALDVATERTVEKNLRSLSCTQVVIAHRLSTIRNANLILVLDDGHIVEGGTHEELLRKEGFYANLIRQQLENGEIVAA